MKIVTLWSRATQQGKENLVKKWDQGERFTTQHSEYGQTFEEKNQFYFLFEIL